MCERKWQEAARGNTCADDVSDEALIVAYNSMTKAQCFTSLLRVRRDRADLRAALEFYMSGHPCAATDECPGKNKALAALAKVRP